MDEERRHNRHEGQERARSRTVTTLEKLRKSGNSAPEIEWRENQRKKNQGECRHPFKISPHQSFVVSRGGEPDQMDGGNIGGEKRRAHDAPGKRAPGQKENLAGHLLVFCRPDPDGKNCDDVGNNDGEVENGNAQLWCHENADVCCDYVSESSSSTKPFINVDFVGRSFNRDGTWPSDMRSVIHEAVSILPSSIIRIILGN